MSKLNKYRKSLVPRKMNVARMMARLQAAEPDAKKLKANFPAVFEQVFAPKQQEIEVYEGKR